LGVSSPTAASIEAFLNPFDVGHHYRAGLRGRGGLAMGYPITNIQGIGADTAVLLKSEGIRTTIGLLHMAKTPKQRLKIAEKIGTNDKLVLGWVTAADRMRVKGIGWEYAELLRAVGVKTVNELKYRNPEKLAEEMRDANARRALVRLRPSATMVKRWVENAKKLPALVRY
jgi:predicted flap endonuclease-1-like 5' DNA nuclease